MPTRHVYTLKPGRPTPGLPNLLRPPIASRIGAGILTGLPSATTLVLALGTDSPCADERGAGNLGLSASGPFTRFIATHVSIRSSDTSSRVLTPPSLAYGTLSYHRHVPLTTLPKVVATPGAAGAATNLVLRCSGFFTRSSRPQVKTQAGSSPAPQQCSERNVPIHSFGAQFEPRYIFRAGRLDQ